jgi:N-acetyl-anhydromuramyl-L-alanine amidase AmpD
MYKKTLWVITILLVCLIEAVADNHLNIINKQTSFGNRSATNRKISVIIIHSTYNASGGDKYDIDLIARQFKTYGVSAHYVIGRDGTIYQFTPEENIAFHAGKSQLPDGRTGLNTISIGIEVLTDKEEQPTSSQIQALTTLVNDIKKRHKIDYLLRHSDIAPNRKTDPWNFDWEAFLKTINLQDTKTR